jgi:hypothetical protein
MQKKQRNSRLPECFRLIARKTANTTFSNCNGTGLIADYVGLEMKPVAADCYTCGGSGQMEEIPMSTLPEFTPVSSSNIAAVAHDGENLFVRFHNGAVWKYAGVTPEAYATFRSAPSIGSHFHMFIKKHHPGEKVSG